MKLRKVQCGLTNKKKRYNSAIFGSAMSISLFAEFDVLLTVHLGIILVNNQLDAQFLFLTY